jgi:ubiquinone/menaquinone biosynthesis C-methylase UbiE
MNANKALWEKGDFTRLAETMRGSGQALVDQLGITTGLDVLDLACGDGTTAIPAAALAANVLGVDIASNLVVAGNRRAESLGLSNIRFQEGDACDLRELKDDSFDLVVSIFGAMFAPNPFQVAKEVVRVTPKVVAGAGGPLDVRDSDHGGIGGNTILGRDPLGHR